jgi:fermentation-respiration switch protein FrsA (DUF1100 family)
MRNILVILCACAALTVHAQTKADYTTALARLQKFYNHQQYDSVFNIFSEKTKEALPLEKTRMIFNQLSQQLGEMKAYEYSKTKDNVNFYKTTFAKATVSMLIGLTPDKKLETFRFVPYDDDTKKKEPSNFVLETNHGKIYGTLTIPPVDSRPVPVVLIIAGSGPTDRDGNNTMGVTANTYKMLADSLQLAGIATVRYDKRGICESAEAGGDEAALSFEDMIADAIGFIKKIRGTPGFTKLYVLGHSEGSLIGMIAAGRKNVDGYISVSGISEPADKILVKQISVQSKELGQKASVILDTLKKGYTVANIDPSLEAIFHTSVQPYLRSWMKYDPQQEIKKVKARVLIIQGTTDIQVGVEEAEHLKKAKPDATLKLITGMNHILKKAPADRQLNIATYSNPTLPLCPGLMTELRNFIK